MEGPDRFEIPADVEQFLFDLQSELNRRYWTRDHFGFTYVFQAPCSENPIVRVLVTCEGATLQAVLLVNEIVAIRDKGVMMVDFRRRLDAMGALLKENDSAYPEDGYQGPGL